MARGKLSSRPSRVTAGLSTFGHDLRQTRFV
jgi:hypothetical protein